MKEKHTMPRRSRLLEGMPRFTGFPRRPMRTGTGPSTRNPGQACRFTERVALSEAELDEIAQKINSAGKSGQAVAHTDPVLCMMGAPSVGEMHRLLDQMVADVAADDSPGKDGDLFIDEPELLNLGNSPWPATR